MFGKGGLVALAAVLLVPLVARGTWFAFLLTSPVARFPAHYVRPNVALSTGSATPDCVDLASGLKGNESQLHFCEDAEMLHGPGLEGWALFSCDPGRDKWNTVMGPLERPEARGALWMYAYADAVTSSDSASSPDEIKPTRLKFEGLPEIYDFHPLGFAVHPASDDSSAEDEEGSPARLFVVNHQRSRSTIDVFDLVRNSLHDDEEEEQVDEHPEQWRAIFLRSLYHPLATHTPNSLVALSANEVIVTQDHLFALRSPRNLDDLTETWRQAVPILSLLPWTFARFYARLAYIGASFLPRLETILGLPLGWVTYLKFEDDVADDVEAERSDNARSLLSVKVLARWIAFANGVALSPNGKYLAVASTMMPGILLYEWDGEKREIVRLAHRISTPNHSDNIAFSMGNDDVEDEDDLFGNGSRLLGGGGPSGLELMRFAKDPHNYEKRAHSWIVSISPKGHAEGSEAGHKDDDDGSESHVSTSARILRKSEKFSVRTIYQGHGPVHRQESTDDESDEGQHWLGIASATSAAYDGSVGGGTLLVPGLYSKPGVMMCTNVGL